MDATIWYHGTRRWEEVEKHGVDFDAPRATDPGDFGWGFYLTKRPVLANIHGRVFQVTIDPSKLAYIENPYFLLDDLHPRLPVTPEEKLFWDIAFDNEGNMLTINADKETRVQTAKEIQRAFLAAGFTGIRTDYGEGETVLFSGEPILALDLLPP